MGRFVLNRKLPRELLTDPNFRARLTAAAHAVRRSAISLAPEGPTGHYKRSIKVEQDPDGPRVYTDDFAGHLIEYGSKNNPAYAPLRRGSEAAGLRLEQQ